jgi:predicted O-methyltransferase YrrM
VTAATWRLHDPVFEADTFNPSLAVSPWSGHRGFAYDWVAFTRPRRIVELGTHFGCSLFTFAQAVKDHALPTQLVAIDTWEGDAHAGTYDDTVLAQVRRTIEACFAGLDVQLLRTTFAAARPDFEAGSVDLLHIDGLHTREAVVADWETWRDAIAPDGVVFFHDVDPSTGYGSAAVWAELRAKHPHLEFLTHSFGLGVLFPHGDRWLEAIRSAGLTPWLDLYRHRAEARLHARQIADRDAQLASRWEVMQRMDAMVADRDAALASQARLLEERWEVMQRMDAMIADRDAALASQARLLEERGALLKQLEAALADRDAALAALRARP